MITQLDERAYLKAWAHAVFARDRVALEAMTIDQQRERIATSLARFYPQPDEIQAVQMHIAHLLRENAAPAELPRKRGMYR